jgi:hypothetical protein
MQELSELRTSSEAHFRTVENKFVDITGSLAWVLLGSDGRVRLVSEINLVGVTR